MNAFRSAALSCSVLFLLLSAAPPVGRAAENSPARRPAWTTSRLRGTPEPPARYRLEPVFASLRFQKPTCIEEVPGRSRLLVTEIGGQVFTFSKSGDPVAADLLVDLKSRLLADLAGRNVSLFDAEFHPRFPETPYLYLCYVHPGEGGHTRVSRFTVTADDPPQIVKDSEQVVVTWPSGGHNGGCLEFGRDGFLYISTGDGTGPNPPDGLTTGQDVSDLLGAILRIDVDGGEDQRPYAVPADNPFVGRAGARAEIWAYGLRNPWKFGKDPQNGEMFVADNGWETWEMVHRIVRGGNCGWPVMEGRAALRSEVPVGPTPILPPVKDHPHTEANSVVGGPVYRGQQLPELDGSFIYGDYITGTIWALRADSEGLYSHTTLLDTDQRIIAFTTGSGGELYLLDYDFTGQIYQLVPSEEPDLSATFPRRLSETGLFTSVKTLEPAPGVEPYQVVAERWLDGAMAERWVAIPGEESIELNDGLAPGGRFPNGTVFAKHLVLPQEPGQPPIRLETQLLHFENGTWRPYTYLWDDAGSDAELVSSRGADRSLSLRDPSAAGSVVTRTWHANAANECKLCHEARAGVVLGFSPAQLQRQTARHKNQLDELAARRVLSSVPAAAADGSPKLVDPHDPTQSLDDRARSYLHANCSMCHHPGGNAIVSFYLRRDLPFERLNTNKGTGIGTFGLRDARIIAPGDPFRSILLYRMSRLGYARMPYIGSQVVDSRGVALIAEWIGSLPHSDQDRISLPVRAETEESRTLRELARQRGVLSPDHEGSLRKLVATTEGSLALAIDLHRGALPPAAARAAIATGVGSASSDVRGLFETFIPEDQRRKTLGADFDPRLVLELDGDLQRGQLIFFSDGARCRNCHHTDDPSRSLGPTLHDINRKFPKSEDLLKHVLNPSLQIDEPVAAHVAVLQDGRAVSGLLVGNSDRELVLKTLELQLVRVPRKEVEELRRLDKSLMPERVLSDLTAQEAADLLAYIRSLRRAE